MVEVSTSILSMQQGDEAETILKLEKSKTDYFHIDVMDGKFVEKNTFNKMREYSEYIKRISNLPLDVHLMVEDVETAISVFETIQPNIITFHLEACKDENEVIQTIKRIKESNIKVGIAIKPNTKIEEVYKYIPYVHMVLVMTVEPGKGGQTMITDMLEKISKLKTYIEENEYDIDIEADGGINLATAERVKKAGANILVSGTAILQAVDYKTIIYELKK
ncbi:MAG: ribulose-phosphate 3-epimerase [Clostridia bacterium]|nr:ribulose-phosphate 3-epimerase [Clostridia bacterium]